MRYLLSNDDGVTARGIGAAAQVLQALGHCDVVAPISNCSGFSSALTLDRPLRVDCLNNGFRSVNGTPADCVHLALNGVLPQSPQQVISGINAGANLGDDVLYSGTVAAAIEGRFLDHPALAISLVDATGESDFGTAAQVLKHLLQQGLPVALPARTVLNVNVPALPYAAIKGVEITRLGHRAQSGDVQRVTNPRGQTSYWIGAAGDSEDEGPGTDFHAIKTGYVSITPLQMDMTRYSVFDELVSWASAVSGQQGLVS